jgi:nitroreductase
VLFQRDHFHQTPALIVACYRSSHFDPGTGRRLLTGFPPRDAVRLVVRASRINLLAEAASVYPGVQNILLAARALGLGAVITNFHLFLEHQWKKELGIPKDVNTFAAIPVGWPHGRFGPVTRRPAADAIHRDRW